ncbi:lactonase family protein [uncultured Maribacter sp.]|uniref:lactonase family protein n=1 Tax=uncultured Maribacter sp. TaxID=431308 RepID=UPI00261FED86|nr:lactonase family protein [uncultured Maribacter sp.]
MKYVFYLGSYTEMITPAFGGTGEGIYVLSFDEVKLKIELLHIVGIANPAYIAISSDNKFLYTITEIVKAKKPKLKSFAIKDDYSLDFICQQEIFGGLPCHLSCTDNFVFVACYETGDIHSYKIEGGGIISEAAHTFRHNGSSINKTRQEGPHAHQIAIHPNGVSIYVPDLGIDTIKAYKIADKQIVKDYLSDIVLPKGNGPRHMVFNKKGTSGYVMNELNGDVCIIKNNKNRWEHIASYPSLPSSFKGIPSGSAIRLHPNGNYLYVANRTIDAITIFKIEEDYLTLLGYQKVKGKTLREFNISKDGKWLFACLQDSNELVVYSIDSSSGVLKEKLRNTEVKSPVCIVFLNRNYL